MTMLGLRSDNNMLIPDPIVQNMKEIVHIRIVFWKCKLRDTKDVHMEY